MEDRDYALLMRYTLEFMRRAEMGELIERLVADAPPDDAPLGTLTDVEPIVDAKRVARFRRGTLSPSRGCRLERLSPQSVEYQQRNCLKSFVQRALQRHRISRLVDREGVCPWRRVIASEHRDAEEERPPGHQRTQEVARLVEHRP